MSDSDLANLLEEVDFTSPQRPSKDDDESYVDSIAGSISKDSGEMAIKPIPSKKKVLIADSSLTRPTEFLHMFGETNIDTIRPTIHSSSTEDINVPETSSGT